jgi:G3E family GTPase
MNGCICCTVRQDLIVTLNKLAKRVEAGTLHLDGIIIETTGIADPAPVAQVTFRNPFFRLWFHPSRLRAALHLTLPPISSHGTPV